ncbi:MAG TPA: hypothetical protein VKF59_02965 [Candidatus Dormibacteraeota bacterium]|nr:hypothetical protein [Candidatus Dormibacteraeota bacterium]
MKALLVVVGLVLVVVTAQWMTGIGEVIDGSVPLPLGTATPAPKPPGVALRRTSPSDFQAGFAIVAYGPQPPASGEYAQLLDRLVSLDVNSLSIVFPLYTDGVRSDAVHAGPNTPSDETLAFLIRQARARGFSVMLRPILDESVLAPDWRGDIQPRSPAAWFASYDPLILSYARLAQREGIDSLSVGTELTSMETYVSSWTGLIAQTRQVFSGQITYTFNFGATFQTALWAAVDFVSIDAYFPLDETPAAATAAQMAVDWQRWLAVVQGTNGPYHKSVVFTEVGLVPKTGAHLTPWNGAIGRPFDLNEQRSYYEATCSAVAPAVNGMYWWSTGPTLPGALGPSDFNPLGRPAENVVRTCYAEIEGLVKPATGPVSR